MDADTSRMLHLFLKNRSSTSSCDKRALIVLTVSDASICMFLTLTSDACFSGGDVNIILQSALTASTPKYVILMHDIIMCRSLVDHETLAKTS